MKKTLGKLAVFPGHSEIAAAALRRRRREDDRAHEAVARGIPALALAEREHDAVAGGDGWVGANRIPAHFVQYNAHFVHLGC